VAAAAAGSTAVVTLLLGQGVDVCEVVPAARAWAGSMSPSGPLSPGGHGVRGGPPPSLWATNALAAAVQGGHADLALQILGAGFSLTSILPAAAYVWGLGRGGEGGDWCVWWGVAVVGVCGLVVAMEGCVDVNG
jgi:hypothetical protein